MTYLVLTFLPFPLSVPSPTGVPWHELPNTPFALKPLSQGLLLGEPKFLLGQ